MGPAGGGEPAPIHSRPVTDRRRSTPQSVPGSDPGVLTAGRSPCRSAPQGGDGERHLARGDQPPQALVVAAVGPVRPCAGEHLGKAAAVLVERVAAPAAIQTGIRSKASPTQTSEYAGEIAGQRRPIRSGREPPPGARRSCPSTIRRSPSGAAEAELALDGRKFPSRAWPSARSPGRHTLKPTSSAAPARSRRRVDVRFALTGGETSDGRRG